MIRAKSFSGGLAIGIFFLISAETACPAALLKGEKAAGHIGSLAERADSGKYSSFVLERRNFHPRTDAEVDGLVLDPQGGAFRQVRRDDSDHKLVLRCCFSPAGKRRLTPETLVFYQEMIRKNKLKPYVLLDRKGDEVCIVYCAFTPCYLHWSEKDNGEILLILKEFYKPRSFFRLFLPRTDQSFP